MLTFKSISIMEFSDEESLEVFVRILPLKAHQQIALLERKTVEDDDKVQVTGCKKVTHTFSIEGEE